MQFLSHKCLINDKEDEQIEGKNKRAIMVASVKNPPATAGDAGEAGLTPGLGRSLGVENGFPLQYSCLENPMDRGAWRITVPWGHKELDTTE